MSERDLGVKYGKGAERVDRTDKEPENKVMVKGTCLGVKDTPFKGMKNGVSLGTVSGDPESSREGEGRRRER